MLFCCCYCCCYLVLYIYLTDLKLLKPNNKEVNEQTHIVLLSFEKKLRNLWYRLLTKEIFRHLIQLDTKRFDFTCGKFGFMNAMYEIWFLRCTLFGPLHLELLGSVPRGKCLFRVKSVHFMWTELSNKLQRPPAAPSVFSQRLWIFLKCIAEICLDLIERKVALNYFT